MEKNIVRITASAVQLTSGLTDSAFSKTNMVTLLEECGWEITFTGGNPVFTPWYFEKTERTEAGDIIFSGPAFQGTPLYDLFLSDNTAQATRAGYAACRAITAAITQKKQLTACGAGGIIFREDDDGDHVLFLPGNLFDRAARNQPEKVQSIIQGQYLRLGLTGTAALLFTRAVITYRILCGAVPYGETAADRRQADILDAAYTPADFIINGLSSDLAEAIQAGLATPADTRDAGDAEPFPIELLKQESGIQDDGTVTIVQHTPVCTGTVFEKRRASFLRKQKCCITIHRFVRRNTKQLLFSLAAICILISVIHSFNKENERLATSTGLTSAETVATLYTGIHRADVTIVQEMTHGSKMKNLLQIVSGFYVNIRTRQSMEETAGTATPAEWFFFRNTSNFWLYGITGFMIDGKPASTDFQFPTRGSHASPLTEEDSVPLKTGMTKTHIATYYFVHCDSDDRININKTTDTVTVTWRKNRWVVTGISGSSENETVSTKAFRNDYQTALSGSENDIFRSAAALRETYQWIPRTDELMTGAQNMVRRFNSTAAKEYLEQHK
jgi:hypothetical protein